jgi:hypothetical protein
VRTRLLPLLLLPLAPLLLPAPASAVTVTSPAQIADALLDDPVYVEEQSGVPLDESQVRDAVRSSSVPTYVVAVSQETAEAAGSAADLVVAIGRQIGDTDAAVVVITSDGDLRAAEGNGAAASGVDAGAAAQDAITAGGQRAFTEQAVTAVLVDTVRRIESRTGSGTAAGSGESSSGGSLLLPLLAVGALGGGAYALVTSRRRRADAAQEQQDARADVESLYGRLGSDVQLLAPGDDAVARQALADAGERYNAAGAIMAKADTPGEWAAARRTVVEGLTAARVVRERLGLDPGPEIAVPAGSAPHLDAPRPCTWATAVRGLAHLHARAAALLRGRVRRRPARAGRLVRHALLADPAAEQRAERRHAPALLRRIRRRARLRRRVRWRRFRRIQPPFRGRTPQRRLRGPGRRGRQLERWWRTPPCRRGQLVMFFFGSGRRGGFPVGLLLVVGVFFLLSFSDGGGLLLFPLLLLALFVLSPSCCSEPSPAARPAR